MDMIPKEVKMIKTPDNFINFTLPLKKSIKKLVKSGNFILAFFRVLYSLHFKINGLLKVNQGYTGWDYFNKVIPNISKEYHVAIGYLEKMSIYTIVDKVVAEKKIGWVHTNYGKIQADLRLDAKYFHKLSNIVTVSEHSKKVLQQIFLQNTTKFIVISNIISSSMINKMANESTNTKCIKKDEISIATVGRLIDAKGIDIAARVCKKLINSGYKIKWNIIGEGLERNNLQNLIDNLGISKEFYLIGEERNPYTFIKQSDIYVQPSRYEGFGITIAEAKALKKPIVASDIPEFCEQLVDGETGLIVPISIDGFFKGIKSLIDTPEISQKLVNNLNLVNVGNEDEIYKLYELFD